MINNNIEDLVVGANKMKADVKKGICPVCGKNMKIDSNRMFKDQCSVREYHITGFCQACQDDFYGDEDA